MKDKDKELIRLVKKAKNGDNNSIEQIYNACKDKIYYICYRMVNNSDDAVDLTQDVFITIFSKLESLDKPENLFTWINTIAINKCKDFFKKKKELLINDDETDGVFEVEDLDEEFIPHSYIDNKAKREIILGVLEHTLSDVQRAVVMLYYYEEKSIKEIAELVECSEGTVKSRLASSRRVLKMAIEEEEKKGVKLHNVAYVPVLALLLQEDAKATTMPVDISADVLKNVLYGINASKSPALLNNKADIVKNIVTAAKNSSVVAKVLTIGAIGVIGTIGVALISCNSVKEEKVAGVVYNNIPRSNLVTQTANETETATSKATDTATVKEDKKEEEKVYTSDTTNMREDASLDSPVIEVLQTGTEVKKISEKDGWTKVKRGETEGYIVSQYLTVTKPEINEVVEENNAVGDTNNSAEENNYVAENTNSSGVSNNTAQNNVQQSKPSNNTNNTQSNPSNSNNTQSKPENNQSSGGSNQGSNAQPTTPSQPEESNPPKQEVIMGYNHWGGFPSTDTFYGILYIDKDCSEGYPIMASQYNKFKAEGRIGTTTKYECVNGGETHAYQVECLLW